ncbi:hypothetical protein HDU88_006357 [Geranomyces variabilis]|nr:hypothetical protein HDU88_006357 [Geranomyces variabilis]
METLTTVWSIGEPAGVKVENVSLIIAAKTAITPAGRKQLLTYMAIWRLHVTPGAGQRKHKLAFSACLPIDRLAVGMYCCGAGSYLGGNADVRYIVKCLQAMAAYISKYAQYSLGERPFDAQAALAFAEVPGMPKLTYGDMMSTSD